MNQTKAPLFSGLLAGVAGLLVFLTLHHLWIKPIWFILPLGLVIAGLGGMAAGWAYHELLPHLPGRPWTSLVWAGLVGLTLAPAVGLAELRPPAFVGTGMNVTATITVPKAVTIFVSELLLTATITGFFTGWLIGRTRRAGLAMALAGFVFALGPGHNVPFLANTPATAKGLMLLLAIIASASVILVEAQAALARKTIYLDLPAKIKEQI